MNDDSSFTTPFSGARDSVNGASAFEIASSNSSMANISTITTEVLFGTTVIVSPPAIASITTGRFRRQLKSWFHSITSDAVGLINTEERLDFPTRTVNAFDLKVTINFSNNFNAAAEIIHTSF